ncbi:MAG TPA: alpha/beta hydrolase family protein [Terriglobia bacterium]|nr:alpha/beta hydrolase family protein [Terriglobia bacterium]
MRPLRFRLNRPRPSAAALALALTLAAALTAALAGDSTPLAASRPPRDSSLATPSSATTIQCDSVASAILSRPVNYCICLPADYQASPSVRYPVLYYLHGLFEHERSWGERGGEQILDDLVQTGQVGKFLVVLPDGGKTFYVNSEDGHDRYEDFFVQEFVPAIDAKYRTEAVRGERAIGGSSMGGYGALHIGMRHPDLFGSVSAQSAALLPKFPDPVPTEGRWGFYARVLTGPFGSPLNAAYFDANNPLTLAEHPERFANIKLYFDCGDHDRYGFEDGAQRLDQILTAKGFAHEFHLRPGEHGWSYLTQYMKYALLFHWKCFEEARPQNAKAGGAQ